MFTQARRSLYDVLIIGSGAAGGITAKVLVEAGLNVVMLEAGPMRDYASDFPYHEPFPYEDPFRGTRGGESKATILRNRFSFTESKDEPLSLIHISEPTRLL